MRVDRRSPWTTVFIWMCVSLACRSASALPFAANPSHTAVPWRGQLMPGYGRDGQAAAYDWRHSVGVSVVPRSQPPKVDELVRVAESHLGIPYAWGGMAREKGFDCSGYVNTVYAQLGYDLPRTSREQFKIGLQIPRSHLQPGDLIFFGSEPHQKRVTHVAIYLDDDDFIHAATGKGEVSYDQLTTSYYDKRYLGARRILSLPTGRYSTAGGTARRGYLLRAPEDLRDLPPPTQLRSALGSLPGPVLEALQEHELNQQPLHLVPSAWMSGGSGRLFDDSGPLALRPENTSLGVRTGISNLEGKTSLLISPEFTYFGHDNALQIVLGAPLAVTIRGKEGDERRLETPWKSAADYGQIIRQITYGKRGAQFFLDMGRTLSGTLGYGHLMRAYTPNALGTSWPQYAHGRDDLSLSAEINLDIGGLELFVDDMLQPRTVGVHLSTRRHPLTWFRKKTARRARPSRLILGLTYAADWRAPMHTPDETERFGGVHGIGTNAAFVAFSSPRLEARIYGDLAGLRTPDSLGGGAATGLLVEASVDRGRSHLVQAQLEGRISQATFMPGYFDFLYAQDRVLSAVSQVEFTDRPKARWLAERGDQGSSLSAFGLLSYRYRRRFRLALSYEDGSPLRSGTPLGRVPLRNLMVSAQLRHLYIPKTRHAVSLYAAYHLRGIERLAPPFGTNVAREYLYAAATLELSRHVAVSTALRRHTGRAEAASSRQWEAFFHVRAAYVF